MLRSILTCLTTLIAIVVALFLALVCIVLIPYGKQASPAGILLIFAAVLIAFGLPIAVYRFMYNHLPKSRGDLRREVTERQQQAIDREIPQKAVRIAQGGEGVWQTGTWRVTGGNTPRIEILENGLWSIVFEAQFHAGKPGQWVPSGITRDFHWITTKWDTYRNRHTIHARNIGGSRDWWEVLIYHPGPWEEELDEQLRAAEDAALARDRARMGL